MRGVFFGLAVALQAISGFSEHRPHRPSAHRMFFARQRFGQIHRALTRPAQRRRIASGGGFDQSVQRLRQSRIGFAQPLAPATLLACPRIYRRPRILLARRQLGQSLADGVARHPRCAAHCAHAASAVGLRFGCRPLPAHALIHQRFERSIPRLDLAERGCILHAPVKTGNSNWSSHAAKVFGADKTYFVLNGTSTSNKVVTNAVLRRGDLVLFDRNNHKSLHQGALAGAGAIPIFLPTATTRSV